MNDSANFFIKEGYRINPVQTFNTDGIEAYWTKDRIDVSKYFQYHIYQFAKQKFVKNGFQTVVDIGAGPATKMQIFFSNCADHIAIVDQATVEPVAKRVLPTATFFSADLEDAKFSTGQVYDMVICSDVIEHLENPGALLEIVKRHLKPHTGLAVISTPDRELRWGKDNLQSPNKQHVREWNAAELKAYLTDSGFEVVQQINFPLRKLPDFIFRLSRLPFVYRNVKKSKWYPNQTVVARLR